MSERDLPLAIEAATAAARTKPSDYPEPFASRMARRRKQPLGDLSGFERAELSSPATRSS